MYKVGDRVRHIYVHTESLCGEIIEASNHLINPKHVVQWSTGRRVPVLSDTLRRCKGCEACETTEPTPDDTIMNWLNNLCIK